jgi:hypothetical protein
METATHSKRPVSRGGEALSSVPGHRSSLAKIFIVGVCRQARENSSLKTSSPETW